MEREALHYRESQAREARMKVAPGMYNVCYAHMCVNLCERIKPSSCVCAGDMCVCFVCVYACCVFSLFCFGRWLIWFGGNLVFDVLGI